MKSEFDGAVFTPLDKCHASVIIDNSKCKDGVENVSFSMN